MSSTHAAPWGGKTGKSASQSATQVIDGMAVAARKSRTTQLQNLLDLGRGYASCQQNASDPKVHDTPVRLGEALANVPAPHPGLIDLCGLGGGEVVWRSLRPQPSRRLLASHSGSRF